MPAKTLPAKTFNLNTLPSPENLTRRELPNGIVVLVRENHTSPAVVIEGDLHVGALWEPREKAGLSSFTASSLMRGTERQTFAQIYEDIEAVGASLGFSSGTHTAGFHGKALAEDLGLLLRIATDALRRPTFPAEQIERLRGERMTHLAIRANNTYARADEAFYELAYANHPYSISEDGTPETLRATTRDDLIAFHRQNYGPQGMIIVIVGAVNAEAAIALVEQHLGDWRNPTQTPEPPLPPIAPLTAKLTKHVPMPGKTQSDIVLGVPGPARSHPHFITARVANNILGVFGMGGRIGKFVREKGGMAYYSGSNLDGGLGPGAWRAYAGVNPKNVERAIELTLREINKMLTRKVTAEELDDNKAYFLGRLPLSMETNEGMGSSIMALELFQLGLDYFQRYPAMLNAVTRDDVMQVVREFWSVEKYALVVAGPEEKDEG